MKNLLFTAVALIAFSGVATASNSKQLKMNKKIYPFTTCYEIGRTYEDTGVGIIKVTISYRCVTFDV